MAIDPKILIDGTVLGESASEGEAAFIDANGKLILRPATAADIASGTFADARISESSVTQHQAALTITESQISDLGSYVTQAEVTALIDTFAELDAIVADANLVKLADITSGTLTARTGNIDLSGGSDGDVLTVQADGSLALETPAGGGGLTIGDAITSGTANRVLFEDGSNQLAQSANFTWGTTNTGLALVSGSATDVPFRITSHVSQSANLLEINSSAGSDGDLLNVGSTGTLTVVCTGGNAASFTNATGTLVELAPSSSGGGYGLSTTHIKAKSITSSDASNFELRRANGTVRYAFRSGAFTEYSEVNTPEIYVGNGKVNATPPATTLSTTGGSGTDIAGGDLNLAGGKGTGAGNGGSLNLQVALPGSTGSSANSLATALSISGSTGGVTITSLAAATVPLTVTAHASQSANLLEVNSSAGSGGDIIRVEDDGYTKFKGVGSHVLMNGEIYRPLRLNATNPLNSTNAIELLNYGSASPRFLEFTYHEASVATRAGITFELDNTTGGYGRIQGRTVTGTDATGRELRLAGGCSTGIGTPGSLILEAAIADAGTGSTKNGLSTGFELTADTSELKLAFFGGTPAAKQAAIADVSSGTDTAYETAINSLIAALENYGLLAT